MQPETTTYPNGSTPPATPALPRDADLAEVLRHLQNAYGVDDDTVRMIARAFGKAAARVVKKPVWWLLGCLDRSDWYLNS
jgi:hypothetical protein